MSSRIETPFTNEHFAAFAEKMAGQPYWYGTTGNRATESLLKRKTAQYPSHYASNRTSKYMKDIENGKIVCDCIGGLKAYAWTGGGESILKGLSDKNSPINSKYGANGCPDKSANGMFSYAKSKGMKWGNMKSLPSLPGIALWKDGHVGYTLDGTWAVEWRSYTYGCQKTKIAARNWSYWYFIPFIDYAEAFGRILKRGMTGADVKSLQETLISLGYPLYEYGADGDFGKETEAALRRFQEDHGLEADGEYGEKTKKAMDEAGIAEEADKAEEAPEIDGPDTKKIVIRSNGGEVFIRSGNGTDFPSLLKAAPGTVFPFVASSENGWNAVRLDGDVGWVSGEYSGF